MCSRCDKYYHANQTRNCARLNSIKRAQSACEWACFNCDPSKEQLLQPKAEKAEEKEEEQEAEEDENESESEEREVIRFSSLTTHCHRNPLQKTHSNKIHQQMRNRA